MKTSIMMKAMSEIPENYVEEAMQYQKKSKKHYTWIAAACLAVLFLTGVPQQTAKAVVAEVKQIEYLTHEEALAVDPLGDYFPSVLPDGYDWVPEGIQLKKSGTDVLSGVCRNEETGDMLTITVAVQSYFGIQTWNIVEPIQYEGHVGSQIYMDFGDFSVHYHSLDGEISDMQGFETMHYSASVHRPGSGGFRMVSSNMYDPISERGVLMHLSLDDEKMTAWQMLYPLSYPLTGTYSLEDHKMIVEMTDNNGGSYSFTYTVITRDLIVLEQIEYNDKAAYGEWIEAHVPLETVLYRHDFWSDTNKKEDQY